MFSLFQTWFHFIDRKTKKEVPTKFYTDAMVFFHHVNAYEEDGHIIFDIIAYTDNSLYDMFYLKNLDKDFEENVKLTSIPTCRRFVVPLQYDKVERKLCFNLFFDLWFKIHQVWIMGALLIASPYVQISDSVMPKVCRRFVFCMSCGKWLWAAGHGYGFWLWHHPLWRTGLWRTCHFVPNEIIC